MDEELKEALETLEEVSTFMVKARDEIDELQKQGKATGEAQEAMRKITTDFADKFAEKQTVEEALKAIDAVNARLAEIKEGIPGGEKDKQKHEAAFRAYLKNDAKIERCDAETRATIDEYMRKRIWGESWEQHTLQESIDTPGGAGFGSPAKRDPELTIYDVEQGYVDD